MTMQDIRRLEDETREELDRVSSRIYLLILPLLLGIKMSQTVTLKEINVCGRFGVSTKCVVLGEERRSESKFL